MLDAGVNGAEILEGDVYSMEELGRVDSGVVLTNAVEELDFIGSGEGAD